MPIGETLYPVASFGVSGLGPLVRDAVHDALDTSKTYYRADDFGSGLAASSLGPGGELRVVPFGRGGQYFLFDASFDIRTDLRSALSLYGDKADAYRRKYLDMRDYPLLESFDGVTAYVSDPATQQYAFIQVMTFQLSILNRWIARAYPGADVNFVDCEITRFMARSLHGSGLCYISSKPMLMTTHGSHVFSDPELLASQLAHTITRVLRAPVNASPRLGPFLAMKHGDPDQESSLKKFLSSL